ncbi:MAG: GNAT family N-acetyltransferase [Desulfomonile tiedjei]|nr:GNAT family N-acetyltransferase [Desulfomonile tiedjei]
MQDACDYSRITIPNDRSYGPVATAYVAAVADRMGFDPHDIELIGRSVREAVDNVVEHAFEPYERTSFDISCERVPLGLKVVIKDQGFPFEPDLNACPPPDSEPVPGSECGPGISLMRELMDEVHFNNLGQQGKETVLIKYLKTATLADYHDACELEPYDGPASDDIRPTTPVEITVQPLEPSLAIEVSRSVYRAYGYSYSYEHVYYPERILELNRSGQLFSAVAVTSNHEVAGHLALMRFDRTSRIAEMGMAAVKPRFRSRGIFSRLTEFVMEKARSEGLTGVYGRAVTNHTYSQQVGLRMGLRDAALTLGFIPATASFKEITETLPQRDSTVIHFTYLQKPTGLKLYLPTQHREVILQLYRHIGISSGIEVGESSSVLGTQERSVLRTVTYAPLRYVRIDIEQYGEDVVHQVKTQLKKVCLEHAEVINLYLDLSDPLTGSSVAAFEELGFFFSGILPGGCAGDALILQYLNNVPIDYEKVKVKSDMGRLLLDYVRQHDPNE